jgi:hypothetical protein
MRAIARRLDRLEERFGLAQRCGPAVENWETRHLRMRLEAARLRCGSPPISPERQAELRGMRVVHILNAARQRAAGARHSESGTPHPGLTTGAARQVETEGKIG